MLTKAGFTHTGWDKLLTNITGNVTITAQWTENQVQSYTVTFNPDGGTLVSGNLSQTVATGGSATAPVLTKAGYTLTGWDKPLTNITGNVTITAQWTQNPVGTYTVTFDPDGGTLVSGNLSQTVATGGSATAPVLTKAGYTLTGWDKLLTNITSDVTITAQWKSTAVNPPIITGGGSSGHSSGGSGGGSTSKADVAPNAGTATTGKPLAKTDATKLFTTALAAKPEGATTLSIKVRNVTKVDKAVLAELAALAQKNGVTLTVHFDSVKDGKVVSRISINPAAVTTSLDLTVKIVGNKITLPKFTIPVELAVTMPAGMTIENLKITQNGKDITASAKPWLDKAGYLHFTTTGGEIVLSVK